MDFLVKIQTPNKTVSIIIEYDGFKEHFVDLDRVNAANYGDYYKADDIERQKVLEGYGYRFLRINRFNIGKNPVDALNERLVKLAKDAFDEVEQSPLIDEVKETASGLASGDLKVCPNCGEPKPISRFYDESLKGGQGGVGRKCIDCKTKPAALRNGGRRRRSRRW